MRNYLRRRGRSKCSTVLNSEFCNSRNTSVMTGWYQNRTAGAKISEVLPKLENPSIIKILMKHDGKIMHIVCLN